MNRDVCVCVCPCKQFGYCDFWIQTEPRSRARGCGALRRNGFARAGDDDAHRRRTVLFRAREEEGEGERRRRRGRVGFISCAEESGNDERVNRIERTRGGWVAAAFSDSFIDSLIRSFVRACVREF